MNGKMGETYTAVRPRAAVLWNGRLLEELGIANLLKSIEFSITVGRSRPSVKLPTGKPKVGQASFTFLLPNEEAAQRILQLLYADERPLLTVGFGYHDAQSYWVGSSNIRTSPDRKMFARAHGFKIDTVRWTYSNAFPTVVLNGMVGRTLGASEDRLPRSWAGKTLVQICDDISKRLGFVIRIHGKVPSNLRLENAVQFSGESAVDALDRLTRMSGATLHMSTMTATAVPGASRAYDYVLDGVSDEEARFGDYQDKVRTVLTIKAIEDEFVNIDSLEQARPIRIAWAPGLSPLKFKSVGGRLQGADDHSYDNAPDYVAVSIEAEEDNVAAFGVAAAGVSKAGSPAMSAPVSSKTIVVSPISASNPGAIAEARLTVRIVDDVAVKDFQKAPETKAPKAVVTRVPDSMGGSEATAAVVRAANFHAKIKTHVTVTLQPGAPELVPGGSALIVGTYTHDGLYGVEETRFTYDARVGLKTVHTLRPVISGGTARASTPAASKQAKVADGSTSVLVSPIDPSDPGRIQESTVKVKFVPDSPSAVPSAPSEAALDAEIGAAQ